MEGNQLILPSPVVHKIGWNPAKMRNVLRSPLKIHGGKFYLSEAILNVCAPALAACDEWVEPCAGGANTSLQAEYRKGVIQVVADVDPLTANVWRVFTTEPLALACIERLQSVDVPNRETMEREFHAASFIVNAHKYFPANEFETITDDWRIALATATIVNSRMSRGGMGRDFAWQDRDRGGQPGEINSWKTFVWNHSPRVVNRCRNWVAFCADAIQLALNGPDWGINNPRRFYYFDPPYVKSTRVTPEVYRADGFDHLDFIATVFHAKSKIAISGYANPVYDQNLTRG
jgi:hypothetical protein